MILRFRQKYSTKCNVQMAEIVFKYTLKLRNCTEKSRAARTSYFCTIP
ncbi:DUF6783 domain-containing protein [Otoolea muris]